MTIVLRLQGLDVKAGTEDIRSLFKCLHIPDGGVYIVGGRLREAFIAFSTERDAQLAMRFSGHFLKGSKVTLHISSMEELEDKLKSLLKRRRPSPTQLTVKNSQPSPDASQPWLNASPHTPCAANLPPTPAWTPDPNTADLPQPVEPDTSTVQASNALDSSTAFLLGMCTVLQGLQSAHQRENNEEVPRADFSKTESTAVSDEVRAPEQSLDSQPGYVRLFGLPVSTTKEVICQFFKGLTVQEVIVNVKLGLRHCCLVKFDSVQDASDALLFNQQLLGSVRVEVRGATEKMWISALQECENALDVREQVEPKQTPLGETANHKQKSTSATRMKRRSVNQLPPESPKKPRLHSESTTSLTPTKEYTVMVRNLPKTMTKTEIKELLGCPNIAHKNVLHLLNKEGNRTDTAFLIFDRSEDYDYAMNLTGCHVGSDAIEVSSITVKMMRDIMAKTRLRGLKTKSNRKRRPASLDAPEEAPFMNVDKAAHTCLFVRNMPADVQKSQIKSFFHSVRVKEENIILLLDSEGNGIGEAVIQFKSRKLAALAQKLHGQDFHGAKVLLTSINVKQMEDILARNV